ncbi:hypothetical protein VHEMI02268 [[Torrubiella] hemipterigena]|uniref:Px domain containing protein n=1 Tax=[Torrubiella] hemipterigena TaxID=1531966 RepID=A0A0A1SVD9_9HYPO|nr:hypothetical protein VHEMI02268 [[Torrubiella] hemipterigena]
MTQDSPPTLSPEQIHALFDILTHYQVYAEIESFKHADTVNKFGPPFSKRTPAAAAPAQSESLASSFGFSLWGRSNTATPTGSNTPQAATPGLPNASLQSLSTSSSEYDTPSASPILQTMLSRLVLPIPGISELPRGFWTRGAQGILSRFGAADLSESYDKGAMGTRKTLATGASSIIEMLARATLGGFKGAGKEPSPASPRTYDKLEARDLTQAWEDFLDGGIYGDLVDKLFQHMTETDDLDAYSPTIKLAAEYVIIHLATFVHYVFIQSPEGTYILKLLDNINTLIPYTMIIQTLRIGNAATMINGMVRLFLAKLSVTSITNWVGLTANEDDGMNLLQRIMSLVLSWDASEFKKIADKIDKDKAGPSPEVLKAIREHVLQDKAVHDALRAVSKETSESIVVAILNTSQPGLATSLTESQHAQCIEYYSALLSVRDRDCITAALCRQPPDLFTQAVKDVVAAYDPIIRTIHSHTNLRQHMESLQEFISDFLKVSIPKKDGGNEPKLVAVEDYVALIRRHRAPLHRFLHDVAKNCPDVRDNMKTWSSNSMAAFRQIASDSDPKQSNMGKALTELYASLDVAAQPEILDAITSHASYLSTLKSLSSAKFQYIVKASSENSGGDTTSGPGIYLSRWEGLLDETAITPERKSCPVRHGRDVRHQVTNGKIGVTNVTTVKREEGPPAPDVSLVTAALGDKFVDLVKDISTLKKV